MVNLCATRCFVETYLNIFIDASKKRRTAHDEVKRETFKNSFGRSSMIAKNNVFSLLGFSPRVTGMHET